MKKVVGKLPPFAKNAHRCQAYKSMLHVPIYDEKKFSEVSIPLSSKESIHMQHLTKYSTVSPLKKYNLSHFWQKFRESNEFPRRIREEFTEE